MSQHDSKALWHQTGVTGGKRELITTHVQTCVSVSTSTPTVNSSPATVDWRDCGRTVVTQRPTGCGLATAAHVGVLTAGGQTAPPHALKNHFLRGLSTGSLVSAARHPAPHLDNGVANKASKTTTSLESDPLLALDSLLCNDFQLIQAKHLLCNPLVAVAHCLLA